MQPRSMRRISSAVLAAIMAMGGIHLATPSPVAAAAEYSDTAITTYTVNPAAGRLDVRIDVTVANHKPDSTVYNPCTKYEYQPGYGYYPVAGTCPSTTRYYVNSTFVYLESGAVAVKVKADRGAASMKVSQRGTGYNEYKVSFQSTFNGQTRKVAVTYQLPGGAPRSASFTRVGRATASFCVIANGYDAGSTRIIAPATFALTTDVHGGTLRSTTANGFTTLASDVVTPPNDFWACISGENPGGYARSGVTSPGGRRIELESWPEDTAWSTQVRGEIQDDLAGLETLVGQPLPGNGTIVVKEVGAGELGAYVGTFDPAEGIARISEDLEPGTVAHELSHAWFNDAAFSERWLSEGSAGWAESTMRRTPCTDPGSYPATGQPHLYRWEFAGPRATTDELAVVDYEYAASCFLVSSIAHRISPANLHAALAALFGHDYAYRSGSRVLKGLLAPADWRQWLDAVDELGLVPSGVADLDFAQDLVARFGAASDAALLPDRSKARAQYHRLAASIGTWVLPEAILRPMTEWRFDDATRAMTAEATTYADEVEANAALPDAHVLDGPVSGDVASARTVADLDAALQQAADQLAAAKAVAAAKAAIARPTGVLESIGLIGSHPAAELKTAIAAVGALDVANATRLSGQITTELSGASSQGLIRLVIALGIVLFAAFLLWYLRRRRRTVRIALAAAAEPVSPVAAVALDPVAAVAVEPVAAVVPMGDPAAVTDATGALDTPGGPDPRNG